MVCHVGSPNEIECAVQVQAVDRGKLGVGKEICWNSVLSAQFCCNLKVL